MILQRLTSQQVLHPPKFLVDNCHYLTIMGSEAYGVSSGGSDVDIYGFCIPPKEMVFPHLAGEIHGFGRQIQRFEQYQEHHVKDPDKDKQYDFSIYSIVKYFHLAMENNPNMIDSLFTPRRCVLHSTAVGEIVRDNRKLFLHKGSWHKFKGYAYSQMHKIGQKSNATNPKRAESIEKYGYDVKFAYHVVRLLDEVEQILIEQDIDLERNREQLKAIRRGEWTREYLVQYFYDKEKQLEQVYNDSPLQHWPNEQAIKAILINCLEHHYGSLEKVVRQISAAEQAIKEIRLILDKYPA